jgi:hypothetical protein
MRSSTRRARPAPEPVEVRLSLGDIKPLMANEMAEVAAVDDDHVIETIDREAVAAQQEQPDRPFSPEDLTESGIR